jgi:hypothetical protein
MVISAFGPSVLKAMLSREINRLAKKAVQKPEMLKPLTSLETSNSINALITSRKNPSVRSVSGKVRMTNSGRSTALKKPSRRAEIISAETLVNRMPLNNRLATDRENEVTPHWMKNPARLSSMSEPL